MPQRLKNKATLVAVAILLVVATFARAENVATSNKVEKTYNNSPFQYDMRLKLETDAYRVYRLTYPSPMASEHEQNNTVPADYYLPAGIEPGSSPRPAVVCLHILNGKFELVNMLCSALAKRGIPAIMIKLPYYGERSLPAGRKALLSDPLLFFAAFEQGCADVRRTVDLLASRPEIDADKIGVAGISLGGILSATSAANEPRLKRAALILAGGDLATVIYKAEEARKIRESLEKMPAETQAEFKNMIRLGDPLTHAPGLRQRAEQGRVLMINAAEDRVIPRPCTEKLAAALGISDRVMWLDGLGHYTAMAALPRIMRKTVDFFAVDLPEGVQPFSEKSANLDGDPKASFISLLQNVIDLFYEQPEPGCCHHADLEVDIKTADGNSGKARLRFTRGSRGRFRLCLKTDQPINIEVQMGQDNCPWMAAAGKTVFRGSDGSSETFQNPLVFADQKHILKLQMARGIVTGIALSPTLLDNLVVFSKKRGENGARAVEAKLKGKNNSDAVSLSMQNGSTTPDKLGFSVKGVEGSIKFHVWQINGVGQGDQFHPPNDLPIKEVARDDLYRMFSSLFNFAMEMAQ